MGSSREAENSGPLRRSVFGRTRSQPFREISSLHSAPRGLIFSPSCGKAPAAGDDGTRPVVDRRRFDFDRGGSARIASKDCVQCSFPKPVAATAHLQSLRHDQAQRCVISQPRAFFLELQARHLSYYLFRRRPGCSYGAGAGPPDFQRCFEPAR